MERNQLVLILILLGVNARVNADKLLIALNVETHECLALTHVLDVILYVLIQTVEWISDTMNYASLAGRNDGGPSPPFDVNSPRQPKTQSGQPIDSVDLSWSLRPSGSPSEQGFSYVCAKCGEIVDFEGNHK